MDVAQMGCRARKKSRKWNFPNETKTLSRVQLSQPLKLIRVDMLRIRTSFGEPTFCVQHKIRRE